jgi:Holliday junction resolvasome RuvABC endonuclease subunit
MPTSPPTILALDPGTREVGFAAFSGERLLHFGVKSFRRRRPQCLLLGDISRAVASLAARHGAEVIALERPRRAGQGSALLDPTIGEMRKAAARCGIEVREYAQQEVRRIVCGAGGTTKRDAARLLAKRYPELSGRLSPHSRWEEQYWARAFDAVAVGLVCSLDLARRAE